MKGIFKGKNKINVRKGDEVVVICGRYKGKKGVVKFVLTKDSSVVVEGINKFKRAVKVGQNNNENFLIIERPIFASKVKVVKKAGKVSYKKTEREVKVNS